MLTLPRFEWVAPKTLAELLDHLAAHPADSLIVAGGTDAVPNLKHRLHEPQYVVAIGRIAELAFIPHAIPAVAIWPPRTAADAVE